ncbi:MAG: glutamate synthase (NADPH), homotetrameric [Candidatus Latescibacterota bacterium]|nr:MAG: glutamate synthase (NADPH), homotetrameric [Candidatus Latescibacterota bacterium]RKY66661.1 MAG: glutamate synthase (NADPH), homotetrameric [Candidatus Latescibacterota bacterium]
MARAGTIPRQRMPEQDPQVRIHNFREVPLGYTPELAMREAERCLQCKNPQCVKGCPVEVDIPGFIRLIREGDFLGAARKIKETNNLPAICGRVCPQETQCEKLCVLGRRYEPVAIGRLERFAADYEREHGYDPPALPPPTGKKVAVVGSGPSGLTAAADLAKMGHKVVIFEGLHVPGGVLVYGIPEFRLPKSIVQAEVDFVRSLGVEIRTNWVIGKIRTVDELLEEYDAVYIATGAGAPTFMGIPGENLNGVYSANEYLTRVNLMKAYQFPEADTPVRRGRKVAVIGGGNVAMDAARTARRLGADVTVIYRRSRAEMPARLEEVHHAEEEGVNFQFLTNPVRYIGNDDGWVVAAECIRMELGEPDSSGRRRPVPVPGSEFTIEVDQVIVAIGTHANPLVPSTTRDLKLNERGYIVVDPETGATSREGVFAGGDIVTGAATVIEAMGAGKRAARAIDAYLRGTDGAERL